MKELPASDWRYSRVANAGFKSLPARHSILLAPVWSVPGDKIGVISRLSFLASYRALVRGQALGGRLVRGRHSIFAGREKGEDVDEKNTTDTGEVCSRR